MSVAFKPSNLQCGQSTTMPACAWRIANFLSVLEFAIDTWLLGAQAALISLSALKAGVFQEIDQTLLHRADMFGLGRRYEAEGVMTIDVFELLAPTWRTFMDRGRALWVMRQEI
jgi:hypothetical protein